MNEDKLIEVVNEMLEILNNRRLTYFEGLMVLGVLNGEMYKKLEELKNKIVDKKKRL